MEFFTLLTQYSKGNIICRAYNNGRYRHQMKSDAVLSELKYILETFQKPLMELLLVKLDIRCNAN